jgi:lysozyme family protein
MDFDTAFERVIGHEGVLSLDPKDRGNWTSGRCGIGELKGTKYGISAMTYPDEDIPHLTIDRAKDLYRRDFWDVIHGEQLYDGVAYQVFDFAVNSGPTTAIRKLQWAVGVADDGVWGPLSQKAAQHMREGVQIVRLLHARLEFMTRCSTWGTHGKGWARRIARNLLYGVEDVDAPEESVTDDA